MVILSQGEYYRYRENMAKNLLGVSIEHKKKCEGNCNISLLALRDIYIELVGRKLTAKENGVFL